MQVTGIMLGPAGLHDPWCTHYVNNDTVWRDNMAAWRLHACMHAAMSGRMMSTLRVRETKTVHACHGYFD